MFSKFTIGVKFFTDARDLSSKKKKLPNRIYKNERQWNIWEGQMADPSGGARVQTLVPAQRKIRENHRWVNISWLSKGGVLWGKLKGEKRV